VTVRRTKIVCTIGPASQGPATLEALIRAGMDVARLNFSHGTHEDHARVIRQIRETAARLEKPVAILQDLQGPKIRLGPFREGRAELVRGAEFTLTTRPVEGNAGIASTTYAGLAADVKPGDRLLIADGLVELRVLETDGQAVRTAVVVGGEIGDHKGINLPGAAVTTPSLSEKDREDLRFGIQQGVDLLAVSFVRGPDDLRQARARIAEAGGDLPVIAKLEKPEAVRRLGEILDVADGVMVARGDLGVELPLEEVPVVQKAIIRRAREHAIPVITATQMLESMTDHPRPTRAEASDVANAIFDGTDAVMLSAETAVGRYPVQTVEVMSRIAVHAEGAPELATAPPIQRASVFPDVISEAACRAADEINARAIVAFTQSGFTARLISKYRPRVPVLAFSPSEAVRRRLGLVWGVLPRPIPLIEQTDALLARIEATLLAEGSVRPGDPLVLVAGLPIWVRGTTNLIQLHRVGARP
jgi:pyruvate kinase